MASDDQSVSVKDAAVLIPLGGSALALCWEVGSFLPIGGAAFSFFSITEHIAFAVPALPLALLMAGGTFGAVLLGTLGDPRSEKLTSRHLVPRSLEAALEAKVVDNEKRIRRLKRVLKLYFLFGLTCSIAVIGFGVFIKSVAITALGLAYLIVTVGLRVRDRIQKARVVAPALCCLVMGLATAFGVEETRIRINRSSEQLSRPTTANSPRSLFRLGNEDCSYLNVSHNGSSSKSGKASKAWIGHDGPSQQPFGTTQTPDDRRGLESDKSH